MPNEENPFAKEKERRENPFSQELARRQQDVSRMETQMHEQASGLPTFIRGATSTFLDAMTQFPSLALNAGMRIATNQPLIGETFPPDVLPELTDRTIPLPTGQQITAAAEAVPRLPGAIMERIRNVNENARRSRESLATGQRLPRLPAGGAGGQAMLQSEINALAGEIEHPTAAAAGEMVGDIATLVTGRAPIRNILARRPRGLPRISDEVANHLEAIARAQPDLAPRIASLIGSGRLADPSAQRFWHRALESKAFERLMRSTGKSVETGLEGAVLAALKDNDPVMTGAMAAGGQMASNIVTGLLLPQSVKGLIIKPLMIASVWRLSQDLNPFVEGDIFDAIDVGYDKVATGLTLGALTAVAGGRFRGSRVAGKLAEDWPGITDTLNAIPRGAVLSMLTQIQDEQSRGENTTLQMLDLLSSNPELIGTENARRLVQAMGTEQWTGVLERVSKDERVKAILEDF